MILKGHSLRLVKENGYQTTELVKEISKRYENLNRKIKAPGDVFKIMCALDMQNSPKEKLYCMFLNDRKEIISVDLIHIGGMDSSIVQPVSCLAPAMHYKDCKYMIMVHNHPTGDTEPSYEDEKITERMSMCCEFVGIDLLDHIIIGDDYCNMAYREEY